MENPENIRKPAAAGTFYPSSSGALEKQLAGLINKTAVKTRCIACMLPHAGYAYSGNVAGETLSRVDIKDTVVLLGPNHTGYGAAYSLMAEGAWLTPLGKVRINSGFAKALLERSKYLAADNQAHIHEHSLEVELPFLQYLKPDFQIVPITFLGDDPAVLKQIGKDIADTVIGLGLKDSVLIAASSDMTHYESREEAGRKDREAIKAVLALDADKLLKDVSRLNISMCGYAAAAAMISAAKALGARSGKLIKYQTSGDVTGDYESVVGYAGLIIT